MLKIKLPIPPYDEQLIKNFCDDIVEVKFDPLPNPISCIAMLNHGADIENIASRIRTKSVFGKNIEVEIIEDDESLYQEHIEMDDEDEYALSFCNDFEKNNPVPKQEGIDDETFVRLLQMRLRAPRPAMSSNDIIEILSDTSEEDLDNEEVLSKMDDDASTFINGLLELSNKYNTEETPSSSIIVINEKTTIDTSTNSVVEFDKNVSLSNQRNEKPEINLKRPSEVEDMSMESLLDTMNRPVSDSSNKKLKSNPLDNSLHNENVPSKKNRKMSLNENEFKHNCESDLNFNSSHMPRRLSLTEQNGTSDSGSRC